MANVNKQDPARTWAAVTPSGTTHLGNVRSLYVGGAGDVVAEDVDGTTATFTCAAGTYLFIEAKRVLATGTTATGIVALY